MFSSITIVIEMIKKSQKQLMSLALTIYFLNATTPGKTLPSRYSREAPPPVET